tara:strand:+ start:505 stop:2079 length:1575 start_codon:yes stop_codon:yes gene_type:complete
MARLRQQYSQNYGSSSNINTEFENLVRYVNAAELGEKTIGELLAILFDANGVWQGPIEMRKDVASGIQYRVGSYTDDTAGWTTIATMADLRGASGSNAGTIGAPILHSRHDVNPTSGQTVFDYAHDVTDDLLVYVDGVLQREGAVGVGDYTKSATGGSLSTGAVTFDPSPYVNANTLVTIFKIRATSITGYNRQNFVVSGTQIQFPFVHDEGTKLQVYKNGILQREGGSFDYTTSPVNNVVTFTSTVTNGNLVSIITVENTSTTAVTGLMMEEAFVNTASGLIDYAKVEVDNNEIPQTKVSNLATDLGAKAKITTSASTPATPATSDLWLDTSQTPNILKFYTGTQWLQTSPDSTLPTFTTTDASKYVRVNGTGTALEYGTVDLSSVIATSQRGAANGVASLDSNGKLPSAQLSSVLSTNNLYLKLSAPGNASFTMMKFWGIKVRITGISVATSNGTITVEPMVLGAAAGSQTFNATTAGLDTTVTPNLEIDCTSTAKDFGFITSNDSSAQDLEVTFQYSVIAS